AVELQLVDLAVVERLGIVGVRAVQILMLTRRDADGVGRTDVGDLRLRRAIAVEHLDPLVAGVGDVDVALRVERDAVQHAELARLTAAVSPGLDEVAVLVELGDASITVGGDAVGDVDVTAAIPRDVSGAHEAVAGNAGAGRSGRTGS